MKRDQEQEDLLKAQRRSKVVEELRLAELKARVGGASSSLVLVEVGVISEVEVVMESQSLSTTLPAVGGTPKISLCLSATTKTTIHDFGDIESPASFPNLKA
uniref:Putative ovule protein n=1 Tax=Solanum chacoense TaxID=4108 RepID=A0A0V0HBV8_SOLCH